MNSAINRSGQNPKNIKGVSGETGHAANKSIPARMLHPMLIDFFKNLNLICESSEEKSKEKRSKNLLMLYPC